MKFLLTVIMTLFISINAFAQTKSELKAIKAAEELKLAYEAKDAGNHTLSVIHFKKACDNNSIEGCYNLAVMHKEGKPFTLKKMYSYKLYALAKKLRDNSPNPNYEHITAVYELSCDVGMVPACVDLAGIYAEGKSVAKDELKAAKLYSKACDDGVKRACVNAGNIYSNHKIYDKAAIEWQKACNTYGDGKSCLNLEKLFKRTCDNGNYENCFNLANLYRYGAIEVKVDIQEAKSLYKFACSNDYKTACASLNNLSAKGY